MDETGCFWRGLPEKTLDAKGRQCTGGKKAKQRLTWAFFVNAEGEKEGPVVIGTSVSPRCLKNLQSPSRLCNCSYFANGKACMNTEIMTTILSKLNRQLRRSLSSANSVRTVFKHHCSVFAKKHHFTAPPNQGH